MTESSVVPGADTSLGKRSITMGGANGDLEGKNKENMYKNVFIIKIYLIYFDIKKLCTFTYVQLKKKIVFLR